MAHPDGQLTRPDGDYIEAKIDRIYMGRIKDRINQLMPDRGVEWG